MEYLIKISRSKTNLAIIAETGGSIGKTKGVAQVICRDDGSKKVATYIPTAEEIPTLGQALFVLQPNDYLLEVKRSRTSVYDVSIFQFSGNIDTEENAVFEIKHMQKSKKWDVMPPDYLLPVIEAAKEKSLQEECTEACWFAKKVPPVLQQSLTFPRNQMDTSFLSITDLKQTAQDEISISFSNGIQLLVYVKALMPERFSHE